jgi:hypothetical protein
VKNYERGERVVADVFFRGDGFVVAVQRCRGSILEGGRAVFIVLDGAGASYWDGGAGTSGGK